ncbi:hypothetical protein LF1_41890 [Rubripirellula obstinata]|uniref:Uncharacterized protein n=1 Tax=Rubripirellula obstinata TaxID=406547 RepID=A0A5B1CQW4_9BACT|nr:hypothetical protein [Rubripirellula obstinata]KAA1261634.1 hypothetical protein LF1_41890 [Rubripirellula obstinata]
MPNPNSCNVECSVLIPARTLEDFPTDLDDCDARSTLAAWTVLWHPQLLAATEQIPAWHRADSPPEPETSPKSEAAGTEATGIEATAGLFSGYLFTCPAPSIEQLPDNYALRAKSAGAVWVSGPDRKTMLDELIQAGLIQADLPPQTAGERTISTEDFFAAGFAALQIQIMTRRLRYTSNLDQIHLQTRIVDAAQAFLASRTSDAIEALHDVFDCLAEERDHYFTSDPHLIDLVLVAPSTLNQAITDPIIQHAANNNASTEDEGVLKTPVNVLIDEESIDDLAQRNDLPSQTFRQQLCENQIGWAAGGPSSRTQFDLMDYTAAARAITGAHQKAAACIGAPPLVYGRLSGDTPSDLISAIASQGYAGVIPLNFAAGSGHGSEAKVVLPVGVGEGTGGEIEALTAKPIDASSDAEFLSIGAKLGESIDSGEIATGLLVHWPGQGCDSYHDLRRLASWSLSLGRFWQIGDYFTKGERPYHQGNLPAISSNPPSNLDELFGSETKNQIADAANQFLKSSAERQDRLMAGIGDFLTSGQASENSLVEQPDRIAKTIGMTSDPDGDSKLVVNANSIPLRVTTEIRNPPAAMPHVYSSDQDRDQYVATVDVPAMGYSIVRPASAVDRSGAAGSKSSGITGWIRNRFLGRSNSIAKEFRLQNEFMEVEISKTSGGVAGVYSGGQRGNRFSMRLVAEGFSATESDSESPPESLMRCDDILVTKSTASEGRIEAKGKLLVGGVVVASFVNRYSLVSGSRVLSVRTQLNRSSEFGDNEWNQSSQWKQYIAARVAVQDESAVCRPLVRDKVHLSRGRRIVAPLGLVIDEAQRQTLITSDGYPLHRVAGKRFYDTILMIRGQGDDQFNLRYGFDVSQPVAEAWSGLTPAKQFSGSVKPDVAATSWFVGVGPKEVLISDMTVHQLADKTIGVEFELIATRGKSCTAKLKFYRDPSSAFRLTGSKANDNEGLKVTNDAVQIPMHGHDACRVMVVFGAPISNDDSTSKESP